MGTHAHGNHNNGAANYGGSAVRSDRAALVASDGGLVVDSDEGPAMANGGAAAVAAQDLVLIPAGSPTSRSAELLGSARFRGFLDAVGHAYEVVVLDSTPLLPVSDTLEILPHVDAMIICARASQPPANRPLPCRRRFRTTRSVRPGSSSPVSSPATATTRTTPTATLRLTRLLASRARARASALLVTRRRALALARGLAPARAALRGTSCAPSWRRHGDVSGARGRCAERGGCAG